MFQVKTKEDLTKYRQQISSLDSNGSSTVKGNLFQQVGTSPQINPPLPITISKRTSNPKSYFKITFLSINSNGKLHEEDFYFSLLPAVDSHVAKGLTPGILPGIYTYIDKNVKPTSVSGNNLVAYQSLGTSNRCLELSGLLIPQNDWKLDSASSSWMGGSSLSKLNPTSAIEGIIMSSTWKNNSLNNTTGLTLETLSKFPCKIEIIPSDKEDFTNRNNQGISLIGVTKSIKLFGVRDSRAYYNLKFILLGESLTFEDSSAWAKVKKDIETTLAEPEERKIHTPEAPTITALPEPTTQEDTSTNGGEEDSASINIDSFNPSFFSPPTAAAATTTRTSTQIQVTSGNSSTSVVAQTSFKTYSYKSPNNDTVELLTPLSTPAIEVGDSYNATITLLKDTKGLYYPAVMVQFTDGSDITVRNYVADETNNTIGFSIYENVRESFSSAYDALTASYEIINNIAGK
jgi:hypothetical protein